MEDLKAKQMISTDHQFCILPLKKNQIKFQNYFFKELGKYREKKIPELNNSKGTRSILKVSQIPALLHSLGRVNREKLSPGEVSGCPWKVLAPSQRRPLDTLCTVARGGGRTEQGPRCTQSWGGQRERG